MIAPMADDIWTLVHAERRALATDLGNLSVEQWKTPSLCEGWTIHDVLAHQVATASLTPLKFFAGLAGSGFSFTKLGDKQVAAGTAGGPAKTLAAYTALESATTSPPGPKVSWLGEELIHGEDIRRPLGLTRAYPADAVSKTLDFYKGSNLIVGAKKRIADLQLAATDLSWTTGTGPLVEGPAMSLLMAMTGRKTHLDDLSGPGLETLRSR